MGYYLAIIVLGLSVTIVIYVLPDIVTDQAAMESLAVENRCRSIELADGLRRSFDTSL